MPGSKVSWAGSGSTTTGSATASVPVLVATRLKGATSPGPMRLWGPFDSDSCGVPSRTPREACTSGMGNVDPAGCSWDSPAAADVSVMVSGTGVAGSDARAVRTTPAKHTVAFGQLPVLG
jgi:hypothetical protein